MNSTETDKTSAYAEAVRAALADLPESTRDEMIEDLNEHLTEIAAENDDLVDVLGPPESYAAELRAAAGFVGGFPDPPPGRKPWADLRASAGRRLASADRRIGPLLGYARISEFLVLLRPAWWVLRGYVTAMVLAWFLDDSGQPLGLLPRIGGSELLAVLLAAGAIIGSVWLGRRTAARGTRSWQRYWLYAASVFLAFVSLGIFLDADSSRRAGDADSYGEVSYQDQYGSVRDVFVYDEQGRLIEGARLFDQDGQPIRLGSPWCSRTGEYGESDYMVEVPDTSTYPYCPESAPFRLPSAGASAPSVSPSAPVSAVPSAPPAVVPSTAPSASPASASPASASPSATPRR